MSILDPITEAIESFLISTGVTLPPHSTIFFIFVSIFISLLSNLLYRLVLDLDQVNRDNMMLREHQMKKKQAMSTQDAKLWIRVKRDDKRITELQQKSTMRGMLPMLLTYAPFIFIFTTLRATFQAEDNVLLNGYGAACTPSCGGVAVLPFNAIDAPLVGGWFSPYALDPSISIAGFGFWYFLTAIVTSNFFLKVLGVNLRGMQSGNQQQMI